MVFIFCAGNKEALDFLVFWIFSLNIVFFPVGLCLLSFFVSFVSGVFIHLSHLFLALFIFGVLGPWEFLWRARSYIFLVWLRCVECRAGTIYLSVGLGWVAGLYGFFFFWALLRWVRYDWNSGGVVVRLSLPSSVCCLLSWRADVCGRALFSLYWFYLVSVWYYLSILCFMIC